MFLCGQAAERLFAYAFCFDFFFLTSAPRLRSHWFDFLFPICFLGLFFSLFDKKRKVRPRGLRAVVGTGVAGAASLSDLSYKMKGNLGAGVRWQQPLEQPDSFLQTQSS